MQLRKETQEIQEQFGAFCQSGILETPLAGAVQERLPTYRRLVFNVIKDTLSSAYPLTKKLLGDSEFKNLCADFFAKHACQESQVFRMTRELLEFVSEEAENDLTSKYPFLIELMEFEWTEMEMYMMEDVEAPNSKPDGDYLYDQIVLNPEHRILQFTYPVFKKKPNEISATDCGQFFCYAFRQPITGKILFLDISPVIATILALISEGQSLNNIFEFLAERNIILNVIQKQSVIDFLVAETANGMILGFAE